MLGKTARQFSKPRPTYRDILNPTQALKMNHFLHALLYANTKARAEGIKPDIELCMKVWRGLPVTEEGRRQRRYDLHNGLRERDKAARG